MKTKTKKFKPFTTLSEKDAYEIAKLYNMHYHHHDSIARQYEGYDQPYFHIYDEQYTHFKIAVGTQTGDVKFSKWTEHALEVLYIAQKMARHGILTSTSPVNTQQFTDHLKKANKDIRKITSAKKKIYNYLLSIQK